MNRVSKALVMAATVAIAACRPPAPPIDPFAADGAIATVQAIVAQPVWVTLGQAAPVPAQVDQGLAYGDRIRTETPALAEVGLASGATFRIGGDASLILRPRQIQFDNGQMITWAEAPLSEPVEIVTPAAIAGIRGTTVFVNIEDDPAAPVEFFAWEGQVAIRLLEGDGEVVLTSGEQLFVTPGETDLEALRRRVQPLDRATALRRLQTSPLLNDFDQPIPTQGAIEATVEALE